jgi:hypothetical protein
MPKTHSESRKDEAKYESLFTIGPADENDEDE